jgi:hypothetical protein
MVVSGRRYRWDDVTGNQIIVNALGSVDICAEVLDVRMSGCKDDETFVFFTQLGCPG